MTDLLPHIFQTTYLQAVLLGAIAVFLVQAVCIWRQKPLPAILKPLSYASYALVALILVNSLMLSANTLTYTQIAPAILFFVAVSSTLKAQREDATLIQRKAGLVITAFAYIGILSLIF